MSLTFISFLCPLTNIRYLPSAVVISCASSLDEPSCLALIEGLADRKLTTKQDVFYIHASPF